MSNSMNTKILDLIKKGAFGPPDVIECDFEYKTFVPRGSSISQDAIKELRDAFYKIFMNSSHPTLNPFVDKVLEFKEGNPTFKEALFSFIEKNVEYTTEDCDSKNDIMIMKISMELLVINCLYFFDQEEIQIKRASVQTAFFKYDIEE